MALADTYANIRSKVTGPDKAPWYTRWWWWLVIIGAFGLVVLVWWLAKRREADVKARARVAKEDAKKARLAVEEEHDQERLKELEKKAEDAERRAKWFERRIEESAQERKKIEAAIKGADSWGELDEIEEELE